MAASSFGWFGCPSLIWSGAADCLQRFSSKSRLVLYWWKRENWKEKLNVYVCVWTCSVIIAVVVIIIYDGNLHCVSTADAVSQDAFSIATGSCYNRPSLLLLLLLPLPICPCYRGGDDDASYMVVMTKKLQAPVAWRGGSGKPQPWRGSIEMSDQRRIRASVTSNSSLRTLFLSWFLLIFN